MSGKHPAERWRLSLQPAADTGDQRFGGTNLGHEQMIVQVELDDLPKRQDEAGLRQVVHRICEPAERHALPFDGRLQGEVAVVEHRVAVDFDFRCIGFAHHRTRSAAGRRAASNHRGTGVPVRGRLACAMCGCARTRVWQPVPPTPRTVSLTTAAGRRGRSVSRGRSRRGRIHRVRPRDELEPGLGQGGRQRLEPRHQPARRKRRSHADRQFPLTRLWAERLHAARDPVERFLEMFGCDLAFAGQFEPTPGALEQHDAEEALEAAI